MITTNVRRALSPGLAKILGNTAWLMFDRLVRMGMGVIVGVLVARYLGPDRFGKLNFALSFVAIFGALTPLGLDGILVREIVRHGDRSLELLGTSMVLRIAASLLGSLLVSLAIQFFPGVDGVARLLVTVVSVTLVFQAFDTIDSYFQSQVTSKLTVWAKNSAFLLVAGVRLLLVHTRAPVLAFAIAQVAETALGAAGLVAMYVWNGGNIGSWRFSMRHGVELLKQSWPVILAAMAIMIYMRIDMVMLNVMQGSSAAGIYAAATRVSEVWYFIPTAIVTSVSPSILRSRDTPQLYYARMQRLFSLMTVMAVGIGACIAATSHLIIHTLYSSAYDAAAPILAVHTWTAVFVFLGVAQGPWDFSENLLKLGFYRTASGAVTNVLLNLVLIPRYSALGAAVATIFSYAIAGFVGNVVSRRTRPVFFMQLRSFLLRGLFSNPEAPVVRSG
jgi:polysaccharide transporter, PST family